MDGPNERSYRMETETAASPLDSLAVEVARITRHVADTEGILDDLKGRLKTAKAALMDRMVTEGLSSVKLPSGLRAEIRTGRKYANLMHVNKRAGVDGEELLLALKSVSDFAHCVKEQYVPSTLKATIREGLDSLPEGAELDALIPEMLRPFFTVFEEQTVVVTGSVQQ